jgi:hypothetical protein
VSGPETLRTLRVLWLAVIGALVVLVTVVVVTADADSTVPDALPVLLTLAAALGAFVGVVAVDRSFAGAAPEDDAAALTELRTRAFLQLAIIEAPALLGVALAYVLGPPWVAIVGAAGALVSVVRCWPGRTRLRRIDAAWRDAGHDASLVRALDLDR